MQPFKIRCSQISQIMTNNKKGDGMGETAKTYCETWLKEQLYQRHKEIKSKYLDKGNLCETDSIDFIAEMLDFGLLVKNETHYENEFLTGTPDIITTEHVIDAKNSWDFETFPLFDDTLNKVYFAQVQGYMELTGKQKAKVCYVLSDTPETLIQDEIRRFGWKNDYIEVPEQIEELIRHNLTYSDIKNSLKLKTFEVEKDIEYIEKVKLRVIECRNYIETLKNKLK